MRYQLTSTKLSLLFACSVTLITGCDAGPKTHDSVNPETSGSNQQRPVIRPEDFHRSDRFLTGSAERDILNGDIQYIWLQNGATLAYRYQSTDATEYRKVDTKSGKVEPLFDHKAIAGALSDIEGITATPTNLAIDSIVGISDASIDLLIAGEAVQCRLPGYTCSKSPGSPSPATIYAQAKPGNTSPNGRYTLYRENHNLVLSDASSGLNHIMTTDGEEHWSYGALPESSTLAITLRRMGLDLPPSATWSRDGTKFVSYQLDERQVPDLHLIENVPADGSLRPKLHTYKMNFPGDPEALARYFIFDTESQKKIQLDLDPIASTLGTPSQRGYVLWGPSDESVYLIRHAETLSQMALYRIDPNTGKSTSLIEDESTMHLGQTHNLYGPPNTRILQNGDIIWYSERSGWAHLYLYGPDGEFKHALTSGDWLVRDVLHVDEKLGWVYFTGNGKDKQNLYHRKLYKASLDGSSFIELTPEYGDHDFSQIIPPGNELLFAQARFFSKQRQRSAVSPDGEYFVDHYGAVDTPGTWLLRDSSGAIIAELAKASPAGLPEFTKPEQFSVKSADNKWDLYGVLLKPSNFDPEKSYPVIDSIYPGPQITQSPTGFSWSNISAQSGAIFGEAQALADLGFIVMMFDGRGTPFRSREFRNLALGNMDKAGFLEDHIHALKQLKKTRPYIDLDRVGLIGSSGGGFATATALIKHADFYKVGVASAGNHEQRSYIGNWGPGFNSPLDQYDYDQAFAGTDVSAFSGKLLLAHGELDDNVHPANSMRLAEALIKGGKTFDMFIMPNGNHGFAGSRYFQRVAQRYFLEHLMGAELPPGADIIAVDDGSASPGDQQ